MGGIGDRGKGRTGKTERKRKAWGGGGVTYRCSNVAVFLMEVLFGMFGLYAAVHMDVFGEKTCDIQWCCR